MAEPVLLRVEVVLAESVAQWRVELEVPPGTTAWQAVERSRLLGHRGGLDPSALAVAVHGKQVGRDQRLEDGDRVEVLRPLPQDPKQRRRRLARDGAAMGRKPPLR